LLIYSYAADTHISMTSHTAHTFSVRRSQDACDLSLPVVMFQYKRLQKLLTKRCVASSYFFRPAIL